MKYALRSIFLAGLCLLLATPLAMAAERIFQDFDGQHHSMAEYTQSGKWLVVMFWASDCHTCNDEAHQYVAFHEKHKASDATVLGVSMDGYSHKAAAEEFIARNKVSFPNLIGDFEAIADWYMTLTESAWIGTPTFLVYGPTGELMAKQVGAVPTDLIENFIQDNSAAVSSTN